MAGTLRVGWGLCPHLCAAPPRGLWARRISAPRTLRIDVDTGLLVPCRLVCARRKETGIRGCVLHATHPLPSISVTPPTHPRESRCFSLDPCLTPAVTCRPWEEAGSILLLVVPWFQAAACPDSSLVAGAGMLRGNLCPRILLHWRQRVW